jgi:hypothetical protein
VCQSLQDNIIIQKIKDNSTNKVLLILNSVLTRELRLSWKHNFINYERFGKIQNY